MKYNIVTIDDIDKVDLTKMICESKAQGFKMIERLQREWVNNINRFDKPGELLLGVFKEEKLIGIGGINLDPYHPTKRYGRIRHVYVMNSSRRSGVATLIVEKVINKSQSSFDLITLRTPADGSADTFYESIGFIKCTDIEFVSHIYKQAVT